MRTTTLLLTCLLPALSAAPAPPPRAAAAAAPLAGVYRACWSGTDAMTTLAPGGHYDCLYAGAPYAGTWRLEGGRLSLEEWRAGEPPGHPMTWRFDVLPAPGDWLLRDGPREVRLTRLPAPAPREPAWKVLP